MKVHGTRISHQGKVHFGSHAEHDYNFWVLCKTATCLVYVPVSHNSGWFQTLRHIHTQRLVASQLDSGNWKYVEYIEKSHALRVLCEVGLNIWVYVWASHWLIHFLSG